jgi:hypothetical protein
MAQCEEVKMADLFLQRMAQAPSEEQFEMFLKKDIRAGEERLMLAVLESAVKNYQKYILDGDFRFQEAEKWLFFEQDSKTFCSFENICEILQLHPGYIRQGLLRWKKLATDAGNPERRKLTRSRVRGRLSRIA